MLPNTEITKVLKLRKGDFIIKNDAEVESMHCIGTQVKIHLSNDVVLIMPNKEYILIRTRT